MLNKETITQQIARNKNDVETLDFIKECLDSLEEYHKAVFEEQTFPLLYGGSALDAGKYRERRSAADRSRTVHHNSLIANVRILNRMAERAGLAPVYDGEVSEERPYRRMVANAVLEYIQDIIVNRT